MRFMMMHKMTPEMEKGLPPPPDVLKAIGELMEDAQRQNMMVAGEGLKPTSQRVQLKYKNGQRTLTQGPFTDATELPAGFALMKVKSRDEALAWCDRFAALLGDVELFLGAVVEPWDLGFVPKPPDAPLRFLSMHKADARSESDAPPDPKLMEKMGTLIDEMTKAGVLQATAGLRSTRHGARLRFDSGKPRVLDGPFTESKELVAGYAIFDLPSKEVAIEWAKRFGQVVKVNEVEIRLVA